jgi:hypothetical protein
MSSDQDSSMPNDQAVSLDYSPEGSVAILLGSSKFPRDSQNLPDLPAVVANLVDFERLLRDPSVAGFPSSRVHRLLDEDDASRIRERLADWSEEATDLLLFYYSGHGLIDADGDLLLTLSNSTFSRAEANCLRWRDVKSYVLKSSARRKLVILDCCFSGRATSILGAADEAVRRSLEAKGTVVLASSPRNEPSRVDPEARRTVFTDALLSTIEQGVDTGRNVVSVDELFANAKQACRSIDAPTPERVATADANDIALVLNRQSQISQEASSFEHVVRQIESRVGAFLESRLQLEGQRDLLDDAPFMPRTPVQVTLYASLLGVLLFAVIGEAVWLINLGDGSTSTDYDTGDKTVSYPNLSLFLITASTLLGLSVGVAVFVSAALRSPGAAALARAFTLSRKGARILFVVGIANSVLVLLISLIAVTLPVFSP